MNADAAAHMGIVDGEVVELVSDMGRDRVRVETTPYLHPACIFTSAAPGGRRLAPKRRRSALGVGPLDHTPLRWDPLTAPRSPRKTPFAWKRSRRARIITSN